jgi:glycosyltransferase involved in cell wall biosynthesis
MKAFPDLPPSKVNIMPHATHNFGVHNLSIKNTEYINIGVVGNITFPKGSDVILGLMEEIRMRKANVKLTIIGNIDCEIDRNIVDVTGQYKLEELPDLINKYGVNILFFSSIWPETFSYVTHELASLNVPIVAFNFGSPSEKLKKYKNALLINSQKPDIILNNIINFFNRIYKDAR